MMKTITIIIMTKLMLIIKKMKIRMIVMKIIKKIIKNIEITIMTKGF